MYQVGACDMLDPYSEAVFERTIESRVPPLKERWVRDGVPFVEFLGTTFQKYYEWTTKK